MDPWIIQLIAIQVSFTAFLIWIVVRYRTERSRQRTQERIRLLERFESAAQLEGFLASDAGKGFMKDFMENTAARQTDPRRGILVGVAVGITSFSLGLGLLLLASSMKHLDEMAIPGTIFAGAGLGVLVASLVSMVLVRLWRLNNGHKHDGREFNDRGYDQT